MNRSESISKSSGKKGLLNFQISGILKYRRRNSKQISENLGTQIPEGEDLLLLQNQLSTRNNVSFIQNLCKLNGFIESHLKLLVHIIRTRITNTSNRTQAEFSLYHTAAKTT